MREVEGQVVVFDRTGEHVHHLNPTASFVWSRLDGRTGADEIANGVAERFAIEAVVALRDVESLLEQLSALNLLEPDSDA